MDNSISDFNKTNYFEENSVNLSFDQSSSILGLNASLMEQQPRPQEEAFEKLTLDWELLEKEPILLQQTAKLLENRATDPVLSTLSAQFRELSEKIHNNDLSEQLKQKQQHLAKRTQHLQRIKQLNQKYALITNENEQRFNSTSLMKKQNRVLISQINQLKVFVKQMATDRQNNPFAMVNDLEHINSLRIVSEINEELGKQKQKPEYQDLEDQIKAHNEIMIEERNIWLQIAKELDSELKNLIEQEQKLLENIKNEIIESKQKRAGESRQQRGNDFSIVSVQDNEVNFQTNIIPNLIEETINKNYKSLKNCQKIQKPLERYFDQNNQHSEIKRNLQSELKHSQSILAEKTSKCALLQKQQAQLEAELRKLQNMNNSQVSIDVDQVNYEGLVFKTYEQKESMKRNQRLEDNLPSAELPKPAKRIVVEKQSLQLTQNLLPFIKNYKQLVNWALAFWLLVILMVFTGKALVKSGVWLSPEPEIELEIPERPVIHTIQSKHKPTEIVFNKSNTMDVVVNKPVNEGKVNDDDWAVLEVRRKQMEQVNNDELINEQPEDDWRKKIIEEGFE